MTYVFKDSNPCPEDIGKDLGPRSLFRFLPFCYLGNKGVGIDYLGDVKRTKKRNHLGYLEETD